MYNPQSPIFKNDVDRSRFLETLAEACMKTGWQIHASCPMANRFPFVVETPQGNLVAGMKRFLGRERMARAVGEYHRGEEKRETDEEKAKRIVADRPWGLIRRPTQVGGSARRGRKSQRASASRAARPHQAPASRPRLRAWAWSTVP